MLSWNLNGENHEPEACFLEASNYFVGFWKMSKFPITSGSMSVLVKSETKHNSQGASAFTEVRGNSIISDL